MVDVKITFYRDEKLLLRMTHDEYKEILDYVDRNSQERSFITFDIRNGMGEITFRPEDIKYIII
jgi:hypothetical protein